MNPAVLQKSPFKMNGSYILTPVQAKLSLFHRFVSGINGYTLVLEKILVAHQKQAGLEIAIIVYIDVYVPMYEVFCFRHSQTQHKSMIMYTNTAHFGVHKSCHHIPHKPDIQMVPEYNMASDLHAD